MKCRDDVITSVNGVPFPAYDKDDCNTILALQISVLLNVFRFECTYCNYAPEDLFAHLAGALSCLPVSQAKPLLDELLKTFPEGARASDSILQINFQSEEAAPIPDTQFRVGDLVYDTCQQVYGFIVAYPSVPDPCIGKSLVVQVSAEEEPCWHDDSYTPYIHVAGEEPKYMYISSETTELVHRNA